MNVQTKPRPFPKRKQSILPQPTGSPETFNRFVVAKAQALLQHGDALAVAGKRWPADRRLSQVIRASTEPPHDLSNTEALAAMMTADFVESLQPVSAAAQLIRQGLALHFDRYASIPIPDFVGLDQGPPPFVAPGQPAPVGQLTTQGAVLEPRKLEYIVVLSREMLLGSNAEKLVGDALRTKVAFGLDQALFDALPEDEARPAGLRSYNARLSESTAMNNANAAMMDVSRLVGAAESIAGTAPLYFIARSRRMASLRLMLNRQPPNMVFLASAAGQALPESVLLCVAPRALASAVGLPEVELVESATVEMNDAPGSPDLMAGQRVHSMFQSDTIGIRVRIPAAWTLRHPAGANWITCLWPSDVGGGDGGLPEAPFDESTYGRRQGAWEPICEEAPAGGPVQAYVRLTPGAASAWYPLDGVLANYAPIGSPNFLGQPTAPHPPPFDDSTRLSTTAWTRAMLASEGGGGGIEEVPAANGAYARIRSGGTASWADFVTIGVAPTNSPQFTGAPTAPTPVANDPNPYRIPTLESVQRDYVAKAGGEMTGPLVVPQGGSLANVALGFGDGGTGLYRTSNILILSVNGAAVAQFMSTIVAFFQPINAGANPIGGVGDPAGPTDALNQRTGDSRYLRPSVGGVITGPLQLEPAPAVPNDVTNKAYVDAGLAAVATPTVLRTQVFEPNQVQIAAPSSGNLVFDGNVDLPPVGFRYVLVTVEPLFACDSPGGQAWPLTYSCLLIPSLQVPVSAYKIGTGLAEFFRGSASFRAAVDATPGSIRVQIFVSCAATTPPNPVLTQLGVNSTIVTNMRSLVSVQDLGPV